jgi:5'-3' exonuclease
MNIIRLNKNNNIVLVDCSYYIFHRYFATMRWYKFQKDYIEIDVNKNIDNLIFINAFYKHIDNDIKKICKIWKTNKNNIVLCNDCLRSDIWRNDLYDKYKATRNQKNNFNKHIFSIFNEYIKKLGLQSIHSDRLEGDDIIYLTHKNIKTKINSKIIIIITNDNDFLQLLDTNVLIYNMQFKELKVRGYNNANINLLFKAIYGDKSDNIPKIGPGITKEKALIIASLPNNERLKYFSENNLLESFEFNMCLISFEKIPQKYIEIYNTINKIVLE